MTKEDKSKIKQRSLVLQGGGALGAYEVGAIKSLSKLLSKDKNDKDKNTLIFDIVAGTSIGAINGAILVSQFQERRSWNDAVQKLEEFWMELAMQKSISPFLTSGLPLYGFQKTSVYSQGDKIKEILENTIKKYARFPISTNFDNNEPRLLVVATDIFEGSSVTFDSYAKETKYGTEEITIKYKEGGINLEHVMASASVPLFFSEPIQLYGLKSQAWEKRYFWDGSLLSNTPFRELIRAYRSFWYKKSQVPDMESYIVDVIASRRTSKNMPTDLDEKLGLMNSILLSDRSFYDETVTRIFNNYLNLISKLIDLAKNNKVSQREIDKLLNSKVSSSKPGSYQRYENLLDSTFNLTKVVRISRGENPDTLGWSKLANFENENINALIKEGEEDVLSKKRYVTSSDFVENN